MFMWGDTGVTPKAHVKIHTGVTRVSHRYDSYKFCQYRIKLGVLPVVHRCHTGVTPVAPLKIAYFTKVRC